MKRGRKATVKCKNCNKDFEALLINLRQGKALFCSKKCYFEYRKKNKRDEKYANRMYQKKHKYGLTEEEYLNLFKIQSNNCAICNESLKEKKACVDHNHESGKVRGILCDSCNRALGFFKDDIKNLKRAVIYLSKNKLDSK